MEITYYENNYSKLEDVDSNGYYTSTLDKKPTNLE